MNLSKLFNFKYLKQNVKKSKGLLTILVLIIPVITTLILIATNTNGHVVPMKSENIAIANVIGMYIIPVIISFLLYGYVYKRNSVDFVNSMPLTRSTIFVTNFVGGIVIIFVIQLLTAIATVLSSLLMSKIFIFTGMIIDVFIVMFLAYCLVFSISALAMTVSGNFLTQLVITLLITFLVPFIYVSGIVNVDRTIDLELDNSVIGVNNEEIYSEDITLPSLILNLLYNGSYEFYNSVRNVKTLVITAIYFGVGLYLFNKRKMENIETSFSKLWIHLVVKGITLLPMVFIVQLMEPDAVYYGIAVILIFIYYCLYDFITNKKVSLKYTIPTFILSFVALIAFYKGVNYTSQHFMKDKISIDDVKEISLSNINYLTGSSFRRYHPEDREYTFSVDDKNMIREICSKFVDINNYYTGNYYNTDSPMLVYAKLTLNNRSEKYIRVTIDSKAYKDAIEYAMTKEETVNELVQNRKLESNAYFIVNDRNISKEDNKKLIDLYNNTNTEDILNAERQVNNRGFVVDSMHGEFNAYIYRNHRLEKISISSLSNQELFDKMNEIVSKQIKDFFAQLNNSSNAKNINITLDQKISNQTVSTDSVYDYFENNSDILKYIKDHCDDKISLNDSYYIIILNGYGRDNDFRRVTLCLKETEELNYIISKDAYSDIEEDSVVYK